MFLSAPSPFLSSNPHFVTNFVRLQVEDISDEAMFLRHEPLEMDERRKFRCAPRNSIRGGVRARRTDSRAESSGANTPGALSFALSDLD